MAVIADRYRSIQRIGANPLGARAPNLAFIQLPGRADLPVLAYRPRIRAQHRPQRTHLGHPSECQPRVAAM